MKVLLYTAPYQVEVQSLPEPQLGEGEALIEVAACGLCGSDVHGFQGKSRIRVPPMVMGHEFSGRVAASSPASSPHLQVGQRVVVQPVVGCGHCPYCLNGRPNICPKRELIGGHRQGAFAQYVRVPVRNIYPISDTLSDIAGTFVEPLGNAVHMIRLGGGALDRTIVVLGAGTLGLVTVALARLGGARRIIATDVDERRLVVAKRLGADDTVNVREEGATDRILALTGGAELVIDAAGFTASRQQAIAVAASGGTVILLGLSDPTSELPIQDIINSEIAVRGSYASTDADFRHAISVLERGAIDTESWMELMSLEDGQKCFESLATHESELIKVVFRINSIQ